MVAKRYELSDGQWDKIASLLPGKAGDPGRTGADTGYLSMVACGFCALVPIGTTCRNAMANGRRCISASAAGAMPVFGSRYSRR